MSRTRSPTEISPPVPALNVRPTTASAGAVPTARKACAVSATKVKSRVGRRSPRVISPALATWPMTVGMTARIDWRGPKVLNGRSVTTGVSKLAW
ncbi:hypothetical protein SALBM135S_08746 [Streptomyces alboniger]